MCVSLVALILNFESFPSQKGVNHIGKELSDKNDFVHYHMSQEQELALFFTYYNNKKEKKNKGNQIYQNGLD